MEHFHPRDKVFLLSNFTKHSWVSPNRVTIIVPPQKRLLPLSYNIWVFRALRMWIGAALGSVKCRLDSSQVVSVILLERFYHTGLWEMGE